MMGNILIRDVDDLAIAKIDIAAKKAKESRQVHLKSMIERLAHYDVFLEEKKQFEKILITSQQQTEGYLQQQQLLFEKLQKIEMLFQLFFDVDIDEAEHFLTEFSKGGVEE